jgi:alkylation response protein AidB-like acyl-CoA dehydrogenase
MDATYSASAEIYRGEIRAFLDEHLPSPWTGVPSIPEAEREGWLERWRALLAEHSLLAPEWPSEYGGSGLSSIEQVILREEFTLAAAPSGIPTDTLSINMMGPTFLVCGTEAQKKHYLPRILSGEDRWCQGYSEPDAGYQRSENLDLAQPPGQLGFCPVPHQYGGSQEPGHQLPPVPT